MRRVHGTVCFPRTGEPFRRGQRRYVSSVRYCTGRSNPRGAKQAGVAVKCHRPDRRGFPRKVKSSGGERLSKTRHPLHFHSLVWLPETPEAPVRFSGTSRAWNTAEYAPGLGHTFLHTQTTRALFIVNNSSVANTRQGKCVASQQQFWLG